MIRKLCIILCGVALTWACAASGLFLLSGHACSFVRSKYAIATCRVRDVATAIAQYSVSSGRCPSTRNDLISGDYVRASSLVDPWGTSIAYWCSDDAANVVSAGPDRMFGTPDDVTSAR